MSSDDRCSNPVLCARLRRCMLVLFAALCVGTFGAVWWWALRGMSMNVGTAWVMTDFLLFILLMVALAVVSTLHEDQDEEEQLEVEVDG